MGARSERAFKFTKDAIAALPIPDAAEGERVYHDSDHRGLVVRVYPSGSKMFAFYGRVRGAIVRQRIGPVAEMNVSRARAEAARIRADKEAGRETARPEPAAPETAASGPTLRVVFARYIRHEARGKLRTWRELMSMFRKHVRPHARVPIGAVDADWLRDLHSRITAAGSPGAANRVLALLSAVLTFHLGKDAPNPASAVTRNPETMRDRAMNGDEEQRFLRAIDEYEAEPAGSPGSVPIDPAKRRAKQAKAQEARRTAADLLRMLYWTGQRAGNVCAMEWAAVDLNARRWTIAARHFKDGRPHTAMLPDEAVAILKRRKAAAEPGAVYVFPAGNGKSKSGHFVNYHAPFHRVKELAGIDAGETHRDDALRVHDLRHGFATAMANAGVSAFTIQRQLGHRKIQTTERYVNQSHDDVRAAVDRMADRRRAANPQQTEGAA